MPGCVDYVGGLGRIMHRTRQKDEIALLDKLVEVNGRVLDEKRLELDKDPLSVSPPRVANEIGKQIPDIPESLAPTPVTLQLNGLRLKVPYDEYKEKILNVRFDEGIYMRQVAKLYPSRMKDYIILRIMPKSETGFVI